MNKCLLAYFVLFLFSVFGHSACKHNAESYEGPDKPKTKGPTTPTVEPGPKPIESAKPLDCPAIQALLENSSYRGLEQPLVTPKSCQLDFPDMIIQAPVVIEEGSTINLQDKLRIGSNGSLTLKGTQAAFVKLHYANGCPRIEAELGARFNADYAILSGETKEACPSYNNRPILDAKLEGTLSNIKFENILVPIFEITDQLRLTVNSYQTTQTQILAKVNGASIGLIDKLNPIPAGSLILLKLDFKSTPQIRLTRNNQYSYVINEKISLGAEAGASLTVDAGVKVYFTASGGIDIGESQKGEMKINGTSSEPVTFTHMLRTANLPPKVRDFWSGITIGKWATEVNFSNLKMSDASTSFDSSRDSTECRQNSISYGSCIEFECRENVLLPGRKISITKSILENCYKAGIYIDAYSSPTNCGYATLEISNNTFGPNNWFGLRCESSNDTCSTPKNNTSIAPKCP